jgi:hypothetical protein
MSCSPKACVAGRNSCRPLKRTPSVPLCIPRTYVRGYPSAAAARLVQRSFHRPTIGIEFLTDSYARGFILAALHGWTYG